jgi:hemolysin activation/secretion protein
LLGQYSSDPLLSYEQLGIGNLSIGRGYDPNSVPGDRGVAGSLELRYGPINFASAGISPFAFFDAARVSNLGPSGYTLTVKSVGGGLRASIVDRIGASLSFAHSLDGTYPGAPRADDRLLFNLTTGF